MATPTRTLAAFASTLAYEAILTVVREVRCPFRKSCASRRRLAGKARSYRLTPLR